jgi:hypothetical protein
MTVLTFPTNPTLGQRYNAPNQIQYVYDGVKWIVETVASTSLAVTNSVQDRVAPMFVDGDNTGISFTYNAATNVISAEVTAVNGLVNGSHEFTLESNGTLSLDGDPFAITSDSLVNSASSFSISSDGTLTLTHPDEPALHPLATVLTVQKAAGNYHTISGAYGLSLQATPVPSGSGLNTNTNFVDIFHDGISVNVDNNTWAFGTDGVLTLPTGGDIVDSTGTTVLGGGTADTGNFTFSEDTITNGDGLILDTNRGTLAIGTNMETPGVAGHFHIAFNGSNSNPPTSDLFLGDDHNYVKLPGSQLNPATYGVEIGTDNRNLGPQNIEVFTVDELVPPGGVWRLFIDHETYPNLGSLVSVGDTVTTSWGTPITATITDVVEDPGNQWKIHVAQDITAGFSGGDTVSFGSSGDSYVWRFGTDGDLAIPPGKTIRDAMTGDDLLGGGSTSYTPDDTDNWNDPTINTISAALDELAARLTAIQNFEYDGGNANTPAAGELLIDGNGA